MAAALPGIGIFGTNAAVHLLTPVFREKVRARETFFSFKREIVVFSFYVRVIQHCFICRPSDFTLSEDARIEPRNVVT